MGRMNGRVVSVAGPVRGQGCAHALHLVQQGAGIGDMRHRAGLQPAGVTEFRHVDTLNSGSGLIAQ